MKSKSILSIMLVILLTTVIVSVIPTAVATPYALTVYSPYCQDTDLEVPSHFWFDCRYQFNKTNNKPECSAGVFYEVDPPVVITEDHENNPLEASQWYCICIPANVTSAGLIQRAKTRWSKTPMTLEIVLVGSALARNPNTHKQEPVYVYMIHNPTDVAASIQPLYGRAGPETDIFRAKVVKSPDAQLLAMLDEEGHILDGMIRPGDIEELDTGLDDIEGNEDDFTITSTPGFHMGHIGYNIRPDQSYKTITNPDAAFVLSDVNFRHACFHCYNQFEIISSIYGYVVTPVQSMVPPALSAWVNPDVPLHPFNPGSPTANTIYNPTTHENEDACSILRYGGYMYDGAEWVTPYDIDDDGTPGTDGAPGTPGTTILDPDDVVPPMDLWTPTYEVAPTSAEHGARFITELHGIGLTSIAHTPREFSPYMDDVQDLGDFDMYMVFWDLTRFPDHLYTMCSSEHDVVKVPGDYNFPGCNDPELDDAVFTIISSLDHDEKLAACFKAQNILYNESYPNAAFSYMQLYSRILFDADNPDLRGIVNEPGEGIKNTWTDLNMRWAPGLERYEDDETIIIWIWGEEPELLNPCSGSTVYAWDIMDRTLDGLIGIKPYTGEDMPWMAEDWEIQKWATEDDVGELLMGMVPVTNESLGMGDGVKTVFELENCHVVSGSETVYLNNTSTTAYTINYTAGEITFTTAPSATTWINAYYTYNYMLGADCVGSHWHEDWPTWSTNWHMDSWTDTDVSNTLTIGDLVDFEGDGNTYAVIDMTWDIKVENKSEPYNEMKLSGLDPLLPRPPTPITTMVGRWWHEEWPTRSTIWTVTGWNDNGDGVLSRSDQLNLTNGPGVFEYHVDSVTVTLHLGTAPPEIGKVVEFAGTGMKVLFWLRTDVFWQDGIPYTADDAVFNWLFLRDNEIPRYKAMWMYIEDAAAVTPYKVVAYMNITSQFLIYDLAGTAALLPPPVWSWLDGQPLNTIMEYDPTTNHTKPKTAGPWFGAGDGFPGTQLYGTGMWVFESYDPYLMSADLHQFVGYFRITEDIREQKTQMFYEIGDVNRDGYIDVFDLSTVGIHYGKHNMTGDTTIPATGNGVNKIFRVHFFPVVEDSETVYLDGVEVDKADYTMDYMAGTIIFNTAPGAGVKVTADYVQVGYDLQTDLTRDNIIDARDLALVAFYWGDQKEYPIP